MQTLLLSLSWVCPKSFHIPEEIKMKYKMKHIKAVIRVHKETLRQGFPSAQKDMAQI